MVTLADLPDWVLDPAFSGTALALVGLIAIRPALDESRWQIRINQRAREYDDLATMRDSSYNQRPTDPLYAIAPYLALGRSVWMRRNRLAARARQAADLPSETGELGIRLAREWLCSVGYFSRSAGLERQIALRRFLQTNHLNIIREGSICLPFIIVAMTNGQLNREEEELAEWGVALLDLAAFYNSLARQQRQAIYMDVPGIDIPVGPIVNGPRRITLIYYTALDHLMKNLAMSPKHGKRARRKLATWTNTFRRSIESARPSASEA